MRRTSRALALALSTTAIVGTAVAANASTPNNQGNGYRTIVFTTPWVGGDQTYVDLGSQGMGPGDVFLVTDLPVEVNGKRVGAMDGVETILAAAHDGIVSQQVTLRLPGGHVMLDGIGRHDDSSFRLAVVGGTGDYSTVRGEMVIVGEDADRKVNIQKLVLRR